MTTINEVLEGHATFEVEFVDRMVPTRTSPTGRWCGTLTAHLLNPMPSPALFSQIGNRFVRTTKAFAARNRVPILPLAKPDLSRLG